jgi:hypothetical protein
MVTFISLFLLFIGAYKVNSLVKLWSLQEHALLKFSSSLPTWDKAASNVTLHSSKNDNIEDLGLGQSNIISKGQHLF